MNEQEVLKQFIDDYKTIGLSQGLIDKYEGDDYWDIIKPSKILKYLKDNNLVQLMVDNDSNANYYTALTHHDAINRYKVTLSGNEDKWFDKFEEALICKLQYLTSNIFSSLKRK